MFYDKTEPPFSAWWNDLEDESKPEEYSEADESAESALTSDAIYLEGNGANGANQSYRVEERCPPEDDEKRKDWGSLSGRFERDMVRRIWEYAEIVPGTDAGLWRRDEMGNWIRLLDYGDRTSEFGWEVFDPGIGRRPRGVYALRPLHWRGWTERVESLR